MQAKTIKFKDYPEFRPNLTPYQVFALGSFGGTYWRPIKSGVVNKNLKNQHKEFKELEKLDKRLLTSPICDKNLNNYKVISGTSLEYWESKNWITEFDPYGWMQWYCRFYHGRRCDDDERQIKRWLGIAGPNGRFRKRLENMISNPDYDYKKTLVLRQLLQHWSYKI